MYVFYESRTSRLLIPNLQRAPCSSIPMDSEPHSSRVYILQLRLECFPKPKLQSSSLGYASRLHFPVSQATTLVMVPAHVMEISSNTLGPGPQRPQPWMLLSLCLLAETEICAR